MIISSEVKRLQVLTTGTKRNYNAFQRSVFLC